MFSKWLTTESKTELEPLFKEDSKPFLLNELLQSYLQIRPYSNSCLLSHKIERSLPFLREHFPWEKTIELVKMSPSLVTSRPEKMAATKQFLCDKFDSETAMKIISSHPLILGCTRDSLEKTYDFVLSVFGKERGKGMFLRHPHIFGISPKKLEAKLTFLRKVMGRDLEDITREPGVLCRSLAKCLKPRNMIIGGDSKGLSLGLLFGSSDARFRSLVSNLKGNRTKEKKKLKKLLSRSSKRKQKLELVEKKLEYLKGNMERSTNEIMKHHVVLDRSLEKCIIPRHLALGDRHKEYSLGYIFSLSNWVFEQQFKCSIQR